jgi:ketosteroid isomerase-like protein
MKTARHSLATHLKFFVGPVTGLLLLSSLGVCAADLYRWTDSRGVVHYTDKPPHGVNAEKLSVNNTPTLANPRSDTTEDTTETADPDAVRCQAERDRLAILQKNSRIQMENRDGTVRELSDEEIQQEREFSQRAIQRFCSPQQPSSD